MLKFFVQKLRSANNTEIQTEGRIQHFFVEFKKIYKGGFDLLILPDFLSIFPDFSEISP